MTFASPPSPPHLPPGLAWPVDAAGARPASRALDDVLCLLLFAYLATLAFEGTLRWALAAAGAPNLLYVRDAIPVATLAFVMLRSAVVHSRVDLPLAIPIVLLLGHAAIAAILGLQGFAILLALKVLMFIPYGIAMAPLLCERLRAAAWGAAVLWAASLAGVALNALWGRLPWEGLAYDTAFGAMTTTREWWASGGSPRLPGFARASFNAATVLGITGLLVMAAVASRRLRAVVAGATLLAILLTTTKGMVLGFGVAAGWLLLQPPRSRAAGGQALVAAVAITALLLPVLVLLLDVGSGHVATAVPDLLPSVWDRFTTTWPQAFALLPSHPGALFGAGLGGIGTPQVFSDLPQRFNPADNLAVYLALAFGPLGVAYYAVPAWAPWRITRGPGVALQPAAVALVLLLYTYGVASSIVEDTFCSIALGLVLGLAWPPAQPPRPHA